MQILFLAAAFAGLGGARYIYQPRLLPAIQVGIGMSVARTAAEKLNHVDVWLIRMQLTSGILFAVAWYVLLIGFSLPQTYETLRIRKGIGLAAAICTILSFALRSWS